MDGGTRIKLILIGNEFVDKHGNVKFRLEQKKPEREQI
jgi:hypothetical protein